MKRQCHLPIHKSFREMADLAIWRQHIYCPHELQYVFLILCSNKEVRKHAGVKLYTSSLCARLVQDGQIVIPSIAPTFFCWFCRCLLVLIILVLICLYVKPISYANASISFRAEMKPKNKSDQIQLYKIQYLLYFISQCPL